MSSVVLTLALGTIPPLYILSVVFIFLDTNNWRKYFLAFVTGVFILAFSFKADYGDLIRYIPMIRNIGAMSFSKAMETTSDGMYVTRLLFWLAGKTGNPYFMPALSTSMVYGTSFYITLDYAERNGMKKKARWLILQQLMLFPLISVICNIRNVLAFSLSTLAVYREVVQNKKTALTYVLYVVPIFIHSSSISVLLFRLMAPFVASGFYWLVIGLIIVMQRVISWLYSIRGFFSNNVIISTMITKLYRYSSEDYINTEYGQLVANSTWRHFNHLFHIIFATLIIVVYFYYIRNHNKKHAKHRLMINDEGNFITYLSYIYIIAVMVIACTVFNAPHYWRYGVLLFMNYGAFRIETMSNYEGLSHKLRRLLDTFFLLSVLSIFSIQAYYHLITRSYLLPGWGEQFLLNSIYRIIIEAF